MVIDCFLSDLFCLMLCIRNDRKMALLVLKKIKFIFSPDDDFVRFFCLICRDPKLLQVFILYIKMFNNNNNNNGNGNDKIKKNIGHQNPNHF